MKSTILFYLSIFMRRLPYFLLVATVISGVAIAVAITMPPIYVSQARFLMESSQIPDALAAPTVKTPALEQLQIFEERTFTRANLLDIASRLNVLPDQKGMTPDQIVAGMRARTKASSDSPRGGATIMTVSFSAPTGAKAAAVLNEYLTLILQEDANLRTGRASDALDFFEQEVQRLGVALDAQSARILEFKTAHADALPEGQEFRMQQRASLQDRLAQYSRDTAALTEQRNRLVQIFEATGQVEAGKGKPLSPAEQQLQETRQQLDDALLIFAPGHPKVKILQQRVAQLEAAIAARAPTETEGEDAVSPQKAMLDLQLAEIDSRVAILKSESEAINEKLFTLNDAIARTAANQIALDALQRDYSNAQEQYNAAVDRRAKASTTERIELMSRGQKITVIEQPIAPSAPTKPNRVLIAAAGVAGGIAAGIGLIVLMELLNGSARRPGDITKALSISPIATIPYMRTAREIATRRLLKVAVMLCIVCGVPAIIAGVHYYYMPLDLLADRVMNKIGFPG